MRRFPSKTLITLALHACSNSSVVFEGAAFSNGRFESVMSWTETALHREDVLYCVPFQEGINLVHAHANLFFLLIQAAESASTTRNDISLLLNFANEDEAQESFSRTAVLLSPKNDLCIEAILDAFNPIALWVVVFM